MKWYFSQFGDHIHAKAPDGTQYDVPDGKMDSYLGNVLLNAMVKALANPPSATPPTSVPLLTDDELVASHPEFYRLSCDDIKFARAIEQAVRQKAGIK